MPATHTPSAHGSFLMPSLEHATVADAMHPGVMSCDPDAPLTEVARIMATHHVHCVAVLGLAHGDGGESLAWGVISDLDLIGARLHATNGASAATLAQRAMATVEPSTPLREAAELMLGHGASHLLVIDSVAQRPVGILSTLDLAGILAWGEA